MNNIYDFAVRFWVYLNQQGLSVDLDSLSNFVRGLVVLGLSTKQQMLEVGLCTLVKNERDIVQFARLFEAFFHTHDQVLDDDDFTNFVSEMILGGIAANDSITELSKRTDGLLKYSPLEILGDKDFASYSVTELALLDEIFTRHRNFANLRHSRRKVPSSTGNTIDLKRVLTRSTRYFGEPVELSYRGRNKKLQRMVFLIDTSGSMTTYARPFLGFAHATAISRKKVEVFAFGTRLTRISREVLARNADDALANVSHRVTDLAGGTRLGESLREFNKNYGVNGMARGATVVIVSDGWDRGDPSVLNLEMRRLRFVAKKIIWVNPLKVQRGFMPTAKGMAAALPYVDALVEGHSLNSLLDLAGLVASTQ